MKLKLIINGDLIVDNHDLVLYSLAAEGDTLIINATTQGTQPTPEPEPEPTPDPDPTPEPEPPQTGCGPVPANVRVRQTNAPGNTFLETIPSSQTSASTIYAFAFNSGTGSGRVVATRVTQGNGKLVVISKCPGDIGNPAPGRSRAQSSESATVYYSTEPDASPRSRAILEPNTVYYANVINADSYYGDVPKDDRYCGFYFQKD